MYPESRRSGPENETPAVGRRRWGAWARTELQWSGNGLAGLRDRAVRSRIWVTWQSAQQRARRGGTVTMSGSDATDGAGSAAAERPQHTPTPRAGQVARQMDLFGHLWGRHHRHDTGLHSCRPALATTAAVNCGHFVVQDANSVCPPSRRCRPKPAVGGWCSPIPRPLGMEISLIVVEMTPRTTGTDWASASPVTATPPVNGIWSGAQTPGWAAARSRTHEPGQTTSSPHGSDGTDRSPHRSVRQQVTAPRDLHPGSAKAGLSGRRRRCHRRRGASGTFPAGG